MRDSDPDPRPPRPRDGGDSPKFGRLLAVLALALLLIVALTVATEAWYR